LVRGVLSVVMLVGLTLVGSVLAQDGATVSVGDYEVSRGDVFTVTVEIEDGEDVTGYAFDLTFDTTVVEVQSVTVGDFLGADPFFEGTDVDNTLGTVKVEVALEPPFAAGGVDGDGVLAEIEMEAVGRGMSALDFTSAALYDSDGEPHVPTLDPGEVVSRAAMEVAPAHPQEVVGLGTFTETVMIKGAVDLAGYKFTLESSDSSVVAIEDVELGPFLEANSDLVAATPFKTVAADAASFEVFGTPPGAEPVDGADGDGVIAIVHLNALAMGEAELTLTNRATYDTDAVEEEPQALNGLVFVTEVEMSVQPEETDVFVGETFDITIHVDEDAVDLASYAFSLDWDSDYFTVTEVADLGFLGGTATTNLSKDPEAGTLTFEAFLAPPLTEKPDGPGDLATVTFEAIDEGTSAFDLHDAVVYLGSTEVHALTLDGSGSATYCIAADIMDVLFDTPVMVNDEVGFTAVVTGTEPIAYSWDFDSDGTAEVEGPDVMATHTYTASGSYTLTLEATNCSVVGPSTDTMAVPVTVEPYKLLLPIIAKGYTPTP
jgi:hypothetical protein